MQAVFRGQPRKTPSPPAACRISCGATRPSCRSPINYIDAHPLKSFDHALILQKEDPLLPGVLDAYVKQGIRDGAPTNTMLGLPFDTDLAKTYPECRLVVVKKVATCENLLEVFHSLLKDKLNIKKMTFTSGDNAASMEF